jgi:hypothetical protein
MDIRLFLQFNLNVAIDGELKPIIGWGHPDLIFHFKNGPCPIFLDCTFYATPEDKIFKQLMIIMMHDKAYDMYIPVFYVVLPSKHESVYWHALQMCISATDWTMKASTYTCDFEKGLIKTMKAQFIDGIPVMCNFHFKQAIKRKLKSDFHVSDDVVKQLIGTNGVMNILTVIPINEIIKKGIPYCRSKINEDGQESKLHAFWKYFEKTWCNEYDPNLWNYSGIENPEDTLINKTNNALERFNRRLNDAFPTAHPSMSQFVEVIKEISVDYVEKLVQIKHGHLKAPIHQPVTMYSIPPDYVTFKIPRSVD